MSAFFALLLTAYLSAASISGGGPAPDSISGGGPAVSASSISGGGPAAPAPAP